MWVRAIYIAFLKNIIEHKKVKTRLKLITSSLSVVIVVREISRKFHDDDIKNRHYDDETVILLFLTACKLLPQQFWLF